MGAKERKEILKKYNSKFKELTQNLIPLLINFDRKDLKLSPVDHPKYILRNSIFYRCESIKFHLNLLFKIHESILQKCIDNFPQNEDHMLLIRGTDQVMYIFDDIVFNICSMLDYFGNLIGLLYIGRNKMNIKWNGIAKAAMDNNNKLSKTLVAPLIKKQHRNWINHLFGYRSRLIHHKRDTVGSKKSINIDVKNQQIGIDFHIDVPNEFVKIIKKLSKKEIKEKELTIFNVAVWISEESLDVLNTIVIKAKEELEPKIEKEMNKQLEKLKKEKPELFN